MTVYSITYINALYHSSELAALNERQRVDRRRIEDAVFQYALLEVSSWYDCLSELSNKPMHILTTATIFDSITVYHGAFMKRYSGNLIAKYLATACVSRIPKNSCMLLNI